MEVDDTFLFFCVFFLAIIGMMMCSPRRGLAEMFNVGPLGAPEPSKPKKKKSKRLQPTVHPKPAQLIRQPPQQLQPQGDELSQRPIFSPPVGQRGMGDQTPQYQEMIDSHLQMPGDVSFQPSQMQKFTHARSGDYQSQPIFALQQEGQQVMPDVPPRDAPPMQPHGLEGFRQVNQMTIQGADPGHANEYSMTPEWQPNEPSPANAGMSDFSPWQ